MKAKVLFFLLLMCGQAVGVDYVRIYANASSATPMKVITTSPTDSTLKTELTASTFPDGGVIEFRPGVEYATYTYLTAFTKSFTLRGFSKRALDSGAHATSLPAPVAFSHRVFFTSSANNRIWINPTNTDGSPVVYTSSSAAMSFGLRVGDPIKIWNGALRYKEAGSYYNLSESATYYVASVSATLSGTRYYPTILLTKTRTLDGNGKLVSVGAAIDIVEPAADTGPGYSQSPTFVYYHPTFIPPSLNSYSTVISVTYSNAPAARVNLYDFSIDGKGQANSALGRLIAIIGAGGKIECIGTRMANNRGVREDTSLAASFESTSSMSLRECMADNTGYVSWRTASAKSVLVDFCFSRNFRHRAFMDRTKSNVVVDGLSIADCKFWCEANNSTVQVAETRTPININCYGTMKSLAITRTIVDIRNCEGAGYSWIYTGSDSCPLVKLQNIVDAVISDCQFLHGGHASISTKQCFSLKIDPGANVKTLTIARSRLSGGILCASKYDSGGNVITPDPGDILRISGSVIQADGSFKSSAAIDNVWHKRVVFEKNGSTVSQILNIGQGPNGNSWAAAMRMANSHFSNLPPGTATDPIFKFADTIVATEAGITGDPTFINGTTTSNPPMQSTPPKKTATGVSFDDATMVMKTNRFKFSFSSADYPVPPGPNIRDSGL